MGVSFVVNWEENARWELCERQRETGREYITNDTKPWGLFLKQMEKQKIYLHCEDIGY